MILARIPVELIAGKQNSQISSCGCHFKCAFYVGMTCICCLDVFGVFEIEWMAARYQQGGLCLWWCTLSVSESWARIAQLVWQLVTSLMTKGYKFESSMDKNFLLSMLSRTVLGPTQPPVQWVPGTLSLRLKWQEHETDHSPTTRAKSRIHGTIRSLTHTSLVKHRDSLTFYFYWYLSLHRVIWGTKLAFTWRDWGKPWITPANLTDV
jgi:hypothetical protein